jgi:hypothetical protein
MIVDRCQVPEGLGAPVDRIKAVLWCLRGIGAPGSQIRCVQETVQKRTQQSRSMVYRCMKALLDTKVIVQTRSAAPNQSAAYIVRYDRMLDLWCEPEDQEYIRMAINASQPGTRKRVPDGDASKSTSPSPGRTRPSWGRTGVQPGPVVKEEPAIPAKPAPPPTPSADEIDRWLVNTTLGGGGGEMSLGGWIKIARSAKHSVAMSDRLAAILVARGVQDAEFGLAALEKIKDRIAKNQAKSPEGLFTKFLDPANDLTGPCDQTRDRRRAAEQERRAVSIKIREQWGDAMQRQVASRIRAMLTETLGPEATEAVFASWHARAGLGDWDAMLGFIAANYSALTRATTEGAAA